MLLLHLSGKSVLIGLVLLLGVLGVLALVWWLASPGIAITTGLGLVLAIRGLFALLNPSSE